MSSYKYIYIFKGPIFVDFEVTKVILCYILHSVKTSESNVFARLYKHKDITSCRNRATQIYSYVKNHGFRCIPYLYASATIGGHLHHRIVFCIQQHLIIIFNYML